MCVTFSPVQFVPLLRGGGRDVRDKGVNLSETVNARVLNPPKTLFSIRFNVLWLYCT